MHETYFEGKTFERTQVQEQPLVLGEYENCHFRDCDFANANLSQFSFVDCVFQGCNFSLTQIAGSTFRDVIFRHCKMLGLRFDRCNTFALSFGFDNCILDHSSFYQLKLAKTLFKNSHLHDVDFTESNLTAATFEACDLQGSIFNQTILEKCDFRTSYNYAIDPEDNRVKGARFSQSGLGGLLEKYRLRIDPHS